MRSKPKEIVTSQPIDHSTSTKINSPGMFLKQQVTEKPATPVLKTGLVPDPEMRDHHQGIISKQSSSVSPGHHLK